MSYPRIVVLSLKAGGPPDVAPLVEQFLKEGVEWVIIAGEGCASVEDQIDEAVVGDGSDLGRHLTTTSHPGESMAEVLEFAGSVAATEGATFTVVEL